MASKIERKTAAAQETLAESADELAVSAETQEHSADRRTQLAGDRTLLATERTYAAWLRTGLAALAAGVGARALLEGLVQPWLVMTSSVTLILLAEFCFIAGVWRELVRSVPPPRPDTPALPGWLLVLFNGFLVILGGAVLIGVAMR
jgi:putative membrane protein